MKNKIIVLVVILIFILSSASQVYANVISQEMQKDMDNFKKESDNISIDLSEVFSNFKQLGQLLTMIGAGTIVAAIAYMGIKYITSNPETMGKLKVQTIGLLVSGIVIFGAYHIWKLALLIFGRI